MGKSFFCGADNFHTLPSLRSHSSSTGGAIFLRTNERRASCCSTVPGPPSETGGHSGRSSPERAAALPSPLRTTRVERTGRSRKTIVSVRFAPGVPGTCLARRGEALRRFREAVGISLDAPGSLCVVLGAILGEFQMPPGRSQERFWMNVHADC